MACYMVVVHGVLHGGGTLCATWWWYMVCYMVVVWYNVNVIHDGDVVQCTTGTWYGIPRYMVWYMMYAGTCW